MNVRPLIGLDEVRFGMTRDDVERLLGEPEERAVECDGDEQTEAWYYWSRRLSAHFDAEVDWRLTTLDLGSPDAVLRGRRLVGATLDELRAALPEFALEWHGNEFEPIEIDDLAMNLWIEDGVLESIQWSVPLDADEEERWPSV